MIHLKKYTICGGWQANATEIRLEGEKLRKELKRIGHAKDGIDESVSAFQSVSGRELKFGYTDFVAPIASLPPA